MQRHWVQRAISEDGRAIAEAINSVSVPDGIQARIHRSAIVQAVSNANGSYSISHSSVQVEWSVPCHLSSLEYPTDRA
jgi:uncharacterized phage protein gp47/JayE